MPVDFTVWATNLLAAGIAGLVGGTIGSYFRGYSVKKGEIRASYEDFPTIVKQEFARAFEQEAGKRLATHQDIENVLAQVQAVTKETETIKAQIGSDLWTRQMVWQQRREAYANVLTASHHMREALIDLMNAFRSCELTPAVSEHMQVAGENYGKAQDSYFAQQVETIRHVDIAQMFAGIACVRVLEDFRIWLTKESGTDFNFRVEFVAAWRTRFMEAARQDLGVQF